MSEKIVVARARAFSGQRVQWHYFLVDAQSVRVWDPLAGYYTTCHSLSDHAQRRIRKLAASR